ncbi:MAG: mechanosensitive ion channel family protein, partial [bacterium]|nr:mechanosensitive ion channel family protein [bacterium]
AKQQTIIDLLLNITKYVIAFIVVLASLAVYGIDTTSIIASLGIAGALIGLAFQDIIKDFLAGISMIFDNQFAVGDNIQIGTFRGYVTEMGLRTVKIRAYTGEVKIISNHTITEVINYSLENAKLIVDINTSYETDIDKMENVLISLKEEFLNIKDVLGNLEYLGVEKLDNSSVIYRIVIDCKSMKYFDVKRKMLKIIKENFDKNNIKIPYDQLEIYVNNK